MNEAAARCVLLVRAIESLDPEGRLLSAQDRLEASRHAPDPGPPKGDIDRRPLTREEDAFLKLRSAELVRRFDARTGVVSSLWSRMRWHTRLIPWLVLGALVAGLAVNELGPDRRLNLVAFPLLGMMVWNVIVYALLILGVVWHLVRDPRQGARMPVWGRLLLRRSHARARRGAERQALEEHQPMIPKIVDQFLLDWMRWGAPLHAARAKRMFHLLALALALGTIGGMYWRGLGLEYRASWESTFLDTQTVHRGLHWVLGPASRLTGIALPGLEELESLRAGSGNADGANAAPWIHLYAVTAGLVIFLPRTLLILGTGARAHGFRKRFPLPGASDPHFRQVLARARTGKEEVTVLPLGFRPDDTTRKTLSWLLADCLGSYARVTFRESLDYGREEEFLEQLSTGNPLTGICAAVCVNLASTPEDEVHGRFLDGLKGLLNEGKIPPRLLFLAIETVSVRRLRDAGWEGRVEERRESWRRFGERHNLNPVIISATDTPASGLAEDFRQAMWTTCRQPAAA
ncbi:MAG TPA: DUF2868 domain-containing protein [Methylomirabilota bacterium]|nr:DUF2868 domain-containing protein [Methylomirabilota bacterium]